MQIDTFALYVEHRLRSWAHEIAGGATNLDYPSTNMLHRDFGLGGSSRQVSMSDETWITERIMTEVRKESPDDALVLIAVYWGNGRFYVERREFAELLLGRKLTRGKFKAMHEIAFNRVKDFFVFLSRS